MQLKTVVRHLEFENTSETIIILSIDRPDSFVCFGKCLSNLMVTIASNLTYPLSLGALEQRVKDPEL